MISHSHSRSRRAPQPRIVVADDSLEMSRLVALMLGTHGFDVVIAPDGDVALSTILTDGADGLVSDFQMPGLDGLTLCRVLRGLRAYAMLPIVIFTGVEDRDPRLRPLRDIEELRILHKPMGLREKGPGWDSSCTRWRYRTARRTVSTAPDRAGPDRVTTLPRR
jgi:CheY-like chemotaxis protein